MKILIVTAGVLLVACGSSHKIVHFDQRKVDSAVVSHRDTSYKSVQIQQADDLSARDVDITVWYDTSRTPTAADTALARAISRPVDRSSPRRKIDQYAQLIQNAIAASGRPAKIEIHVGSLSDSSRKQVNIDAGAAHQDNNAHIQTAGKNTDKDVTRSGWPWYSWLGIILAILLIILLILKRYHIL